MKSAVAILLAGLLVCCGKPEQDNGPNTMQDAGQDRADRSESGEPADSADKHIQSIRTLYAEAMKIKATSFEKNCDDGALTVVVDVRSSDGKLLWIRHTGGYDHGSVSYEALLSDAEVVFIMKETRTWNFDPDQPPTDDGTSHTIDRAEQHRYYYLDGALVKTLFKSVEARSAKNESLEKMLSAAPNKKHPTPDAGAALEKANEIVASYKTSGKNAAWCF